jgi:hypothetical protein
MNRWYALIALDRHHECADFPDCHLARITRTAQWTRGSGANKAVNDLKHPPPREIVEQIAEVALDQNSIWKTDA